MSGQDGPTEAKGTTNAELSVDVDDSDDLAGLGIGGATLMRSSAPVITTRVMTWVPHIWPASTIAADRAWDE